MHRASANTLGVTLRPLRGLIEYRLRTGPDRRGLERLAEFVPRFMGSVDTEEYSLTLIEPIARIRDAHANLWGSLDVQPPRGEHRLPIVLHFVEDRAVVTVFSHWKLGPATGMRIGDIVEEIDGTPVADLVEEWRPYHSASNEPTRSREIARKLTTGPPPRPIRVSGERAVGVFYPDKTPTHQIGIIPDLEVRPTIAGIRDGRDEVFEEALSYALGRQWRMPGR